MHLFDFSVLCVSNASSMPHGQSASVTSLPICAAYLIEIEWKVQSSGCMAAKKSMVTGEVTSDEDSFVVEGEKDKACDNKCLSQ